MSSSTEREPLWQYVGKFGYSVGVGSYEARVRARSPARFAKLELEVFLDEDWPRVAALPKCSPEVASLSRATIDVLGAGGEWGSWARGTVEQSRRAHIWYFALSGCSTISANVTQGVDFEMHYTQTDKSELSFELQYMPCATLLAVLCLTGFLVHFLRRCHHFRQSVGDVHPMIRALASVVLLQWFAEVLHLLHLQIYERTGSGESGLEACSSMLFMLSQVASCTLLLAVAKGYTLNSSQDVGLASVKRVAMPVALLHAGLVGHAAWQGDHAEKHHENEGAAGWAIVVVRLLLFAWFRSSMDVFQEQCRSFTLQDFLQRFRLASSVYFLSYPAIYIVVQVCAPYLQHPILHICTAATQTCAAVWLSDLFLSKGAYFQVSTLSCSLLPGGCSPARSTFKAD